MKSGPDRAPARAMLYATGLDEAAIAKPLVAVVHSWSNVSPCNLNLRELAQHVADGVGLPRLVVATAGEPLLALASGLGPSLHVPLPDLVLDHLLARHPGHGEPALADQQHAPLPRRRDGRRERRGLRRPVVRRVERQPGLQRRPVVGRPEQRAVAGVVRRGAVAGLEVHHPALDA